MKILIVMFFVLLGSVTNAQEIDLKIDDIITDRPDQTESPVTLPKGFIQVELGGSIEKVTEFDSPYGKFRVYSHSYPAVLLRFGVSSNIELRLAAEYLQDKFNIVEHTSPGVKGISPLSIGTKIQLFTEKGSIPDAALLFHLNIPFNTDGPFQSRYIGTDFRVAVAHTLSDRFSLSYNLGGEWDGSSPAATGIYTLSLASGIAGKLSFFSELYGFLTQGETPDHRFDGGFTYLFAKNVQADLSGGIGITEKSPDFFVGAGVSFRLPK